MIAKLQRLKILLSLHYFRCSVSI